MTKDKPQPPLTFDSPGLSEIIRNHWKTNVDFDGDRWRSHVCWITKFYLSGIEFEEEWRNKYKDHPWENACSVWYMDLPLMIFCALHVRPHFKEDSNNNAYGECE